MENDSQEQTNNSKPWLFKKGQSGNPGGRPKGTVSLKRYAQDYLTSLSDEDKLEYMQGLPKDIIWKMAEGNPETKTDITSKGEAINLTVVNYGDNKPSVPTESVPDSTA